ncbi:GAP1-N2 domain-containing protein [Mycolicibacterium houstonense]|uniref:GAP1-N2 domain-containing protein n=1 Tax=Mycolicibacterium houstonense TaxID=146021 RepID=UPI003F9B4436
MTSRYGQLAYTSFDSVGTAGGWQVKETIGGLTPTETQALITGVRTVFRPAGPVPDFPTPEQLEQSPRRLAYRALEDGAACWHTFPAGSDSTGRPGNVFAHVLLDRAPHTHPRHRAIQWWRAPHWLTPYGPAAVARALLPGTQPELGDAVTKDSVVAFALDRATWRLATLFALLDAVAAALAGGPPVVLGVQSPDAAAQWIGLVSFLMSPGTAARLSFSTFDRADQVTPHTGQVLSAVPLEDLGAIEPGMVVISESETVSLGELGGEPHRTAGGHRIGVTRWSVMAQVVLLDAASARRVLDDIDTFSTQVRDDGLHPAWPMAMAVAGHPEFADAQVEAHEVIAAHSPLGAVVGSEASHIISDVLAGVVGATTADAWRALHELPDGAGAAFADVTYLSRAIADDVWMAQTTPIPLGPRMFHGKPIPSSLRAAIGPALERGRGQGPGRLLRVIDLLTRAGVADDRLQVALADGVLPGLADPGARGLIGADDRLSLGALLLRDGDAEGSAIGDDVLDWLAEAAVVPEPAELAAAQPWDPIWIRAALRGLRSRRRGALLPGDPGAQLWWLRTTQPEHFEAAAAAAVWNPADLLLAVGTDPLPGTAALRTLLGAADSVALRQLAGKVIDDNGDSTAVACAAVRHIEPRDWLHQRYLHTHQSSYTPLWDQALAGSEPAAVHPDFAARLLAFALLGSFTAQPYPQACNLLAAETDCGAEAVARVLPLVDGAQLQPATVVAVSLLRTAAAEAAGRAVDPMDQLGSQLARQVAPSMTAADAESVVVLMAQLSGDSSEGTMRGYRRMVSGLQTRRGEHPSLAERLRGSRG